MIASATTQNQNLVDDDVRWAEKAGQASCTPASCEGPRLPTKLVCLLLELRLETRCAAFLVLSLPTHRREPSLGLVARLWCPLPEIELALVPAEKGIADRAQAAKQRADGEQERRRRRLLRAEPPERSRVRGCDRALPGGAGICKSMPTGSACGPSPRI